VNPGRLGKAKNYTHKMTIKARSGAKEWLKQFAEQKSNEPGRYGIPADKLDEFNKFIESITTGKK
jgi:hypothetical protein